MESRIGFYTSASEADSGTFLLQLVGVVDDPFGGAVLKVSGRNPCGVASKSPVALDLIGRDSSGMRMWKALFEGPRLAVAGQNKPEAG